MLKFKATYWDEFIGKDGDEHTVYGVCEGPSFTEAVKRIEDAFGKDLLDIEVISREDWEDEVFLIDSDNEDWIREALSNIQRNK